MPDTMVERVARAIAGTMSGFDNIHRDKAHWRETRGYLNDQYRDINDWRQDDYLDAARAAIEAMRTPTEEICNALATQAHKPAGWHAVYPNMWKAAIDTALQEQPK